MAKDGIDSKTLIAEVTENLKGQRGIVQPILVELWRCIREHLSKGTNVRLPNIGLLEYHEPVVKPHNGRRKRVSKTVGAIRFHMDKSLANSLENLPFIRQRAKEILEQQKRRNG